MSKPTRFHLLRDDNLATRIKREKIKQISKKESVFGTLSFELCTILQMLHETDLLVQKVYVKTAINGALLKKIKDL